MNKHINDLIARLEAEAARWEKTQQEHVGMAEHCRQYGNHGSAISWVATANNARQHAADLRAAAAAVRLVVECWEALEQFDVYRKEGDFGGVSMMLQYGKFDKSATKAIASIAEWEWKHGQ